MLTPHQYQERGADLIIDNGIKKVGTYLMHDMGMGKTLTCILAMRRLGIPVLVLAPLNAAINTWPDELDKWAPDISYTVLHGPNKEHYARLSHTKDVVILNFEGLYWWYKMAAKKQIKFKKYFVIWDESSMLKDSTTKRWDIMRQAMPIYSPNRVCLSGTPLPGHLEELWAQYYLLDEGKALGRDIWDFRNRYFTWEAKTYTSTIKPGGEDAIFKRIAPITDRLDGDDYLELPEIIHNDIRVELPTKLRSLYDKYEKEFMLEFPEGDSVAVSSAVLNCKLRQFLQGAVYLEPDFGASTSMAFQKDFKILHDEKARLLKSVIETNNGQPVLAPIQFRFEYKIICDTLKKRSIPIINGSTPAQTTKQLIAMWNKKELPLLLCHPRSVAYSLNLQFGGHHVFFMALPWEMDLYKQLIRRLRRQGQESPVVVVHRPVFADTVDVRIAKALATKDANQERLFQAMTRR